MYAVVFAVAQGVFGPPVGRQAVVFVDDLNMPQVCATVRLQYAASVPASVLPVFLMFVESHCWLSVCLSSAQWEG